MLQVESSLNHRADTKPQVWSSQIQLYTDTSLQGMRGFFFEEDHKHWVSATPLILQKHAFTVIIPEVDRKHIKHSWSTGHLLRLSLDSTCKVRVAGVQGVLLMMFLSYKGMSGHVTLRVLMVLMGWAPWAVTWKRLHTSLLEFYITTGRFIVRSSCSTHVLNAIS